MAKKICAVCQYVGNARRVSSKSGVISLLLLVFNPFMWLFYNPKAGPANICPSCGAAAMIPQEVYKNIRAATPNPNPKPNPGERTVRKKREPITARKIGSTVKGLLNACLWTFFLVALVGIYAGFTDPKAPPGAGITFLILAPLLSPWVHRRIYRATRAGLSRRTTRRAQIVSAIDQAGSGEESEFLLGAPDDSSSSLS